MPLKVSDGMGSWIDDFKSSDAPQFSGKSTKDRRDMAIAAYLSKKNESVNEIAPAVAAIAGRVLAPKIGQAVMKKTGSKMLSRAAQGATQGAADSIAKKDVKERLKLGDPRRDSREASRRGKGVSPSKIPSYNKTHATDTVSGTGKAFHRKYITRTTDDSGDHEAQKRGIAIGIGGGQSRAQRAGKKDRVHKGEAEKDRIKTGDFSFGGGDSSAKPKINMKAKPKGKLPEGAVNEISKGKVADYIKKRSTYTMPDAGYDMNSQDKKKRDAGIKKYVKGVKNIPVAVNKLTGKAMVPATDEAKPKKEAYMSGHGHGSGVVYGGKHDDPAFQALMKKHGVTHRLIGKSGKSAKLIGSPDNIRKVLQSEDKTTDAERAAIDAFMKKKGAKQLPPGKAQDYHGKSFSIKPMGISPDKMGLKGRGKHLDKDLVHKEDKAYGPTGIPYYVPKRHPDAVDPKTGKKKYPPHLTLDKMRAAFAPTKGGKDVKKEQGPTGKPSRITRADVDQAKRDLTVAQIRKKISNLRNEQTSGRGMHPNSAKHRIKSGWSNNGSASSNTGSTATNTGSAASKIAQGQAQANKTAATNQQATKATTPPAGKKNRRSFDSGIKRFTSWTKDKVKTHGPWVTTAAALGHALGSVG